MLLPTTLDSLRPRGNFLPQLFTPVQHDADVCRSSLLLFDGLKHPKPLADGGNLVLPCPSSRGRLRQRINCMGRKTSSSAVGSGIDQRHNCREPKKRSLSLPKVADSTLTDC
jgi:hypothetical protein